jgi:adenosine deaminase
VEIAERRIPLTVCPTSNVVIANVVPDVAAHPFAEMRRCGVLATLNSDDPGMMRFDLADEYAAVAGAFGCSLEEMEQISLDGIEASWAPLDEKTTMRTAFLAEFDDLRREFGLAPRNER